MTNKAPSENAQQYSHRRLWTTMAILLILTSIVGIAYPLWWNYRSSSIGKALIQKALPKSYHKTDSTTCNMDLPTPIPTSQHPAILSIPAISMKAPVLQGISNSVLAVAVGHSPMTVWPGKKGESVLLAHDVSYFSSINHLKIGDKIIWRLGCKQYVFKVVSTGVTKPGAILPTPLFGIGLALVTCWPTNALFWTPDRYVVNTQLISQNNISPNKSLPITPILAPKIGVISELRPKDLSFVKSDIVLGKLSLTGSPSKSFRQSPSSLVDTNLVLQDYVEASKAAKLAKQSWWHILALPQVQLPPYWSLVNTTNVNLIVNKSTLKGAIVSSQAATITMVVKNNILSISKVSILPK